MCSGFYRQHHQVAPKCQPPQASRTVLYPGALHLFEPCDLQIEILKRLQREAFSDIMKLRDRQDKVERMLAFHKSSKGNQFTEASTLVKGKVDVLGAFFVMDRADEHSLDAIQRSGITTGIDARITFESTTREKDILVAEFAAKENVQNGASVGPLSLAKVLYEAHFTDWFSAVAIPTGARCRDLLGAPSSHRERALTEHSELVPSLLNECSGAALGITLKKSNLIASLGQFVSGHVDSSIIRQSLGTFGRVAWELSGRTKLSLLGMQRRSRPSNEKVSLATIALPMSIFKWKNISEISLGEDSQISRGKDTKDGSIALMIESEPEENTRMGAWLEMRMSNNRSLRWAVTMSDTPEDESGWGVTVGGTVQGCPKVLDRFQVETFLNLNLSKNFKLQPALVFVMDGATRFPALLLRSSWSL